MSVSWEEVRQGLWRWYAFNEWENADFDSITDEQYERLDDAREALFSVLCDVIGHKFIDDNCGKPYHRFCVYCKMLEVDYMMQIGVNKK